MHPVEVSWLYKIINLKRHHIVITDSSIDCQYKDNVNSTDFSSISEKPYLSKKFLWDEIIIPTETGRNVVISGIKKTSSQTTLNYIGQALTTHYENKYIKIYPNIAESLRNLGNLFNRCYVRFSRVEAWKTAHAKLNKSLSHPIWKDFLNNDKLTILDKFLNIHIKCHDFREQQNQKFIAAELEKYQNFFNTVENNPLTPSQRLACVANEDNNLIIAGAGSGKTSVVIARAGYLVESGQAKPHEILILAYGNKASKETDERIRQKLPHIEGIATSTFHKLGLNIIGSATGKKPRISKLQEDQVEFYSMINKIVSSLTKKDSSYSQRVIDYFVTYLIPYKDEFNYSQQGDYFADLKEWEIESLKSRIERAGKGNGRISLKQEQLKSHEEVVIADFLFVNGINYIYEHPYEIDTATPDKTQYQPDFYLPDYGIYIEHFCINRNGKTPPFVDQTEYLQGIEWKRSIHKQHNTLLVETYSYEMKDGTLTDRLFSKLETHGVQFTPLSFQQLVELLVKIGDEKKAHQFTKLIVTFLELFKQSGYSLDTLRAKADQHQDKPRCHAFIDIFIPIFEEYSAELERSGTVDFNDMIRKATSLIRAGRYESPYKYILVDEFQDISSIRASLVKALVENCGDTVLSCVGDDWQSIYRFSGSDINYTGSFENYFGYTKKIPLDRTFRFNNKINDFATKFITNNPAQLKKDVQSHKIISTNAVTLVEFYKDIDRAIQQCVDDIRSKQVKAKTIYILGRYAFCKPFFLQSFSKEYPEYNFSFDTVHSSKGKEADIVIVVDVNDGRYGFPSKIADDPLLQLVLPNTEPFECAEERRLFYVAVTRAKHHSYILYDAEKPSAFIKEIEDDSKYAFNKISTEGVKHVPPDYGSCQSCGTGKVVMRVMNGGQFFFGCGHYPLCQHVLRTCDSCNKYPLMRKGDIYRCSNPDCGDTAKACKKCKDGVMVKRSGRYGFFWGCSNFGKTKCDYKEMCL